MRRVKKHFIKIESVKYKPKGSFENKKNPRLHDVGGNLFRWKVQCLLIHGV